MIFEYTKIYINIILLLSHYLRNIVLAGDLTEKCNKWISLYYQLCIETILLLMLMDQVFEQR